MKAPGEVVVMAVIASYLIVSTYYPTQVKGRHVQCMCIEETSPRPSLVI